MPTESKKNKTKLIEVRLSALTRVEYTEVLEVPEDLSEEESNALVNQRYADLDGSEFTGDPDYWERGTCYATAADPEIGNQDASGKVVREEGKLVVQPRALVRPMQHFLYTYKEGRSPRDGSGTPKTVRIMEVGDNQQRLVGEKTDTFVDEFQLVMDILEEHKELPAEAFARNARSNSRKYGSAWTLKEAGFADIRRI